jgi:hypothetical protein
MIKKGKLHHKDSKNTKLDIEGVDLSRIFASFVSLW